MIKAVNKSIILLLVSHDGLKVILAVLSLSDRTGNRLPERERGTTPGIELSNPGLLSTC